MLAVMVSWAVSSEHLGSVFGGFVMEIEHYFIFLSCFEENEIIK